MAGGARLVSYCSQLDSYRETEAVKIIIPVHLPHTRQDSDWRKNGSSLQSSARARGSRGSHCSTERHADTYRVVAFTGFISTAKGRKHPVRGKKTSKHTRTSPPVKVLWLPFKWRRASQLPPRPFYYPKGGWEGIDGWCSQLTTNGANLAQLYRQNSAGKSLCTKQVNV